MSEANECRNCHEGGGELIAPCECAGSVKWVHRRCLDTWRTVSPNPSSFWRCDICHSQYRLRRRPIASSRRALYYFKAVRDVVFVLAALIGVIAAAGGAMYGVDQATNFTSVFPVDWALTVRNIWFQLFVFGTAALCFVIGVCGIFYGIGKCLGCCGDGCCGDCCGAPNYRYDTYGYYHACPPWWYWWWWTPPHIGPTGGCNCSGCDCRGSSCSDCNCSGGGGGGGGDAGKAIVIVLAVVVIVIILIGFFVGIALLVYVCQRLVRNHLTLLDKEIQAQALEVVDRSADPEPGPDEVVIDAAMLTEPSAPLMEGDASDAIVYRK